ncbi:MAG TPA: SRPBCC domain-containing protein [Acidimicrobiales bacterium]|nr:SRPBCC domain-containing protein [Acidimicrobiales bacterium]
MREEFRVEIPVAAIWEFFEEPQQVARCLPGVEQIRVIDRDNVEVRATQSLGPLNATFEAKVSVLERQPSEHIRFQATGRSVRGAVGNLRADSTVRLSEIDGSTVVSVEGDVVLAGALGSVGQKAVAKQAGKVTAAFADNLRRALAGDQASRPDGTVATAPDVAMAGTAPAVTSPGPDRWVSVGNGPRTRSSGWAKVAAASSMVAAAFSVLTYVSQRRCAR